MDLTNILLSTQVQAQNIRDSATEQLKLLESNNFSLYIISLCTELANPLKPIETQQLAGILLKNSIFAKDEIQNEIVIKRWLNLEESVRNQIKLSVLQTLASPVKVGRSTAALCIGKIAAIEIPRKLWVDLVDMLLNNINSAPNNDLKQATFEALGYVCEEVPEYLDDKSGGILMAISRGMDQNETDNNVKFAATVALVNSLEFIEKNMAIEHDRAIIMQMVAISAKSTDEKIRMAAYLCLSELAGLYYIFLEPYMVELFNLTSNAIKNETEGVALQAIEFWSTICETEAEILEEMELAGSKNRPPERVCANIAKRALQGLLPLLLECLTLQNEDIDDESWTKAMAAGCCLTLLAQAVGSEIISQPSPVLPFIEGNIQNSNWHFREAAVMAFGSILSGPDENAINDLVSKALPLIIHQMGDTTEIVRDTVAWTLGRICDICPEVIDEKNLPNIMHAFEIGLADNPKIASSICYAIHSLAEACSVDDTVETTLLSKYLGGLSRALIATSEKGDSNSNLLVSSYEAITALFKNSGKDVASEICGFLGGFMERLKNTLLHKAANSDLAFKQAQLQGYLCGVIQSIVEKSPKPYLLQNADNLMILLLEVLKFQNATVHEEALLCIGSIAIVLQSDFSKYMNSFMPFLMTGLNSTQESMVCTCAVGVVTELCNSLGGSIIAVGNELVGALLTNLQNANISRDVKPVIISCLGDIAFAVGGEYERYLQHVMMMLVQASQTQMENNHWDNIDYLNTLRHSIIEAYVGIIHGLSDGGKDFLYLQYIDPTLGLIDLIANNSDSEESIFGAAIGLLRDLIEIYGTKIADKLQQHLPSIQKIIQEVKSSSNSRAKDNAQVVLKSLQKLFP